MVTLDEFKIRFPEFKSLHQLRFDIFRMDSINMMGRHESRWLTFYNVAQANLIAHFLTINDAQAMGDSTPSGPVSRTDVDEVQVEYAVASTGALVGVDADLGSTSYGQAYLRWRRMAFAGPRVIT